MRRFDPSRLRWLGLIGLAAMLADGPGWMRAFVLFFLVPLVVGLVRLVRRPAGEREAGGGPDRPLPGPAARGGALLFLARCYLSEFLTLLSAPGRSQVVAQVRGEAAARRRIGDAEPMPGSFRQRARYTLPFAGEWLVVNGGETPDTSHSWDILSQRFAYDFLIADERGHTHRGDGTRVEDYFAYGEPVLAPCDGEVVAVVEGVRDGPGVGSGWTDWRTTHIAGNSVTIRHAEGEYSLLAHLAPGSICVRPGQHVGRGERVGRCGHSGNSTEPHLHFQLQDHPDFFQAVGLPVRFSDVEIAGGGKHHGGYLRAGMRVRPGRVTSESGPDPEVGPAKFQLDR